MIVLLCFFYFFQKNILTEKRVYVILRIVKNKNLKGDKKMTDKNTTYYRNVNSGEITTSKEIKNTWINEGSNVEYIRYSKVFNEFIVWLIQEA